MNENSEVRIQIPNKESESKEISESLFDLESRFTVGEKCRVTENWMKIQLKFDHICDVTRKCQLFFGELAEFLSKLNRSERIAQEITSETVQAAEITKVDYKMNVSIQ